MSRARWLIAAALATVAAWRRVRSESESARERSACLGIGGTRDARTLGAIARCPAHGAHPGPDVRPLLRPAPRTGRLVNGATEGGPDRPTELWRWSGSAWELLDAAGPPARSFAAIGRDPEREVVVVHGGVDGAGRAFDETLEWDGRDWSVATATGPGPREGAGLAFDAASHRMVLFGGAIGAVQQADTWAWDGADWEQIAEAGPRPRFVSLMTEDRSTDGILLQGGHWVDGNDGDFLADTWRWSDGAWLEVEDGAGPGPRVNSPGAWDDRLGGIVMFGGGTGLDAPMGADTWRWTEALVGAVPGLGSHAAQRACPGVRRQAAVLVLVGGIAEPGGSHQLDVWELGPDGWHQAWPQP